MKKRWVVALGTAVIFASCAKEGKVVPGPFIEKLGNESVSVSQFKYVYQKNNGNEPDAYSEKSLKEYLELFTNFKLKVLEAKQQGLDTAQSFIKELEGYKKQLAQPYLTEKSVTDNLIKEAYERMKEEIAASHILINIAMDADPSDTLKAYQKIADIKKRALAGEDFGKLAAEYSQDPSAANNKGLLGYFTSLQMVYPFEDAAYKTKVGDISSICRTKFGYHIVKVTDRRTSRGEVKVAHIMVRAAEGISAEDSLEAKKKSDEIYAKIKKGEKWDELASQFSDDLGTKNKGGVLPFFGTNAMIPSFEDAAFSLANVGDISAPIKTPYGWHIIKLIEKKGLAEFKDLEPTLKTKVSKDSRSDLNRSFLLARLKKENNFTENLVGVKLIQTKADSSLIKGKFAINNADKDLATLLFTIGISKFTIGDFYKFVTDRQRAKPTYSPAHYTNLLYKEFVETSILNNEESHLEDKYSDYKNLVNEYREGILLFQLMDSKVWNKAINDTLGLKNFFNTNKENYKWNRRLNATIYSVSNKEVLAKVQAELKNKYWPASEHKTDAIIFDLNVAKLTKDDSIRLNNVANILNHDKHLFIEVAGSVDNKENAKSKKTLAAEREKLVLTYLKSLVKDSTKLSTKTVYNKLVATKSAKDSKVDFFYFSNANSALEKLINEKQALTLLITQGLFQKGDNVNADAAEWKAGEQVFEKDGRVIYAVVKEVEEPRYKKLEEVKGVAISDYQNYLEKEWIADLRKRNPVVVNEIELKKLVKQAQ